MTNAGAYEVHFPALVPRDPYEQSGRWETYGNGIFRLKDRKDADYLLAPTHEELFTLLVKDLYSSYKDLPLAIYQIQDKYRDEARPRAGLLRGREFTMKDAYSFDYTDAGLEASYMAQRDAYERIFQRLGLEYVIVAADNGLMGGARSEEFLHPTAIGEDTFVRSAGGYAANVEAFTTVAPEPIPFDGLARAGHLRLAEHADDRDARRSRQRPPRRPRGRGVDRGPHAEERRARADPCGRLARTRHRRACRETATSTTSAWRSRSHPQRSNPRPTRISSGIRCWSRAISAPGRPRARSSARSRPPASATCSTRVSSRARRGSPARTWTRSTCTRSSPDGTSAPTAIVEVANVRAGDPAPDGSGPVELARGMEIGHVFQLGRFFADVLGLKVLDENGKLVTVTMGSYGIGVTRILAIIAELNNDAKGLIWPASVAPFDVHVVAAGRDAVGVRGRRAALGRSRGRRPRRALRRPPQGFSGRQVRRRRDRRRSEDRGRRARRRRRPGRAVGPPLGRSGTLSVADAVAGSAP